MTRRVICIDDDKTIGEIFQFAIGDSFNFKFISDESLAVAECVKFDPYVIFLDLNLPSIEGTELMSLIRNAGVNASFVFISADERSAKVDAMIKLSDCGFMRKPLDVKDIADTTKFAVSLNKILRLTGKDDG